MGALTSKPYAFTARPWELTEVDGFDYFDSLHSPLRLSLRGRELMRILPALKFTGAAEWISDRARFSYDALTSNLRLAGFRLGFRGQLYTCQNWTSTFSFFALRFQVVSAPVQIDLPSYSSGLFESRFAARGGLTANTPRDFLVQVPDSALTPQVIVIAGISLRYTHPVLVPQLRRFRAAAGLLIDLGSASASFADYSLGAGPRALFAFFRFKSRASRLFSKAFFLTSLRFYAACEPLFRAADYLYILPEAPHERVQLGSGIPKVSCSVSAYQADVVDFQIPALHPFEGPSVCFPAFGSGPMFVPQSTVPPNYNAVTFASFLEEPLYTDTSAAQWRALGPAFLRRMGHPYSTYNYYDHFMGYGALRHSSVNLLNLQRNADYRHSHFCTI